MRIRHFLYVLIGLILCSLSLQGQSRQNISLKFMGLSFHPLSGRPNAKLMPNRLDPEAYFVVDLGALLSYEYFIIPEILSVKGIQGLYADCTGRHRLYGGIGPTWIYRRNWYRLPGYVDTKYFEGSPTDKWQRKFLWYGGELEYKFALSPKLDIATTFVPGYPDLMALAVGLSYNL